MKNKIFFPVVLTLLCLFLIPGNIVAAQKDVVADLSVRNAEIISQEENKFKLSFDLNNQKGIQSGVKYAVELLKEDGLFVVDQKTYEEVVNLGEKETFNREIVYKAPGFLSGTYELWLEVGNDNGLTLGHARLGKITLRGTGEYVEIATPSCYLRVGGDEKETKYMLRQGVDIKPEESLVGVCEVINNFENEVTVIPHFTTYHRSTFGRILSSQLTDPITLRGKETKKLNFFLPKADKPQAYDVVLTLLSGQSNFETLGKEQKISNPVIFHYVIQGTSATVQNFKLDKESYKKGEISRASFFWTPSADSFQGARSGKGQDIEKVNVIINLKNSRGEKCARETKLNPTGSIIEIDIPITNDCPNIQADVKIDDSQGALLDEKAFSLESKADAQQKKSKADAKQKKSKATLLAVLLFLAVIVAAAIIFFVSRTKGNSKKIINFLFFFYCLGIGLLMANSAEAVVFKVQTTRIYCSDADSEAGSSYIITPPQSCRPGELMEVSHITRVTFTVDIDKDRYAPGETILITSSAKDPGCDNSSDKDVVDLQAKIQASSYSLLTGYISSGRTIRNSVPAVAPSVRGNYTLELTGSWKDSDTGSIYYATASIPFTVDCSNTSWSPDSSTVCSGNSFIQTSNCGDTRTATGTRDCSLPTCSLSFSPSSITIGQSTIASWSSQNDADGILNYSCTGGLSGTLEASGSFVITPIQTQAYTCTLTAQNSYGNGTCSATVVVGSAVPTPTYTYSWGAGYCRGECGTTGSREVYCVRNDGVIVSDGYCSGYKPSTVCAVEACYLRATLYGPREPVFGALITPLTANFNTEVYTNILAGITNFSEHNCGGGVISGINGGRFVCYYASAGVYTASIRVTKSTYSTVATYQLRVQDPYLNVTLSANPSSGLVSTIYQLSTNVATNIGGIMTYSNYSNRSCGGGVISSISGGSFRCTYSIPGNYTPSITVTRGSLSRTATTTIEVQDPYLNVTLSANPSSGSVSTIYQLSTNVATNLGGTTTYSNRSCGGGVISSISGGSFRCTYSRSGNYTPSITVTRGSLSRTATTTIEVQEPYLNVTLSANPSSGSVSTIYQLSTNVATNLGGIMTYSNHSCGSGGNISSISGGSFRCTYSRSGNYTPSITVTRESLSRTATTSITTTTTETVDCVPDCSCAAATCSGQYCSDDRCGSFCGGTKRCSTLFKFWKEIMP